MDNKIANLLEEYGLDKKEIKVYLTLVEKNELNAYSLAKFTGIHRSTTYAVIERLLLKGFINKIQKGEKIFYSALEINQIMSKVKEKEAILLSLIPEFENIKKEGISKVRVLESKEGQKQFNFNLFNQLRSGKIKELYIISGGPSSFLEDNGKDSGDLTSRILLENLLKELKKKNSKSKIEFKRIWNIKFKGSKILKLFSGLGEDRFLEKLPTLATIVIFGEHIAYLFTMNGIPQAIEIQNKFIAEENKAYFSYLWKQAKQ